MKKRIKYFLREGNVEWMLRLAKSSKVILSILTVLVVCFLGIFLCEHLFFIVYTKKIISIKKEYPKVMSTTETLKEILSGKSISRLGDGELKLIMGMGLGKKGNKNEYQAYDKRLSDRLRTIIKSPTKNCIIAINNFCDKWDDTRFDDTKFSYWEAFWLVYWEELKDIYNKNYKYGCAEVSRVTVFKENDIRDIKKIWDKRKVLFVVGNGSYFVYEKRLFDNIKSAKILVVDGISSFDRYDSILSKIMTFDKQHLILLCLGPCATVLAYDLSKEGYQALDIGHLPNSYLESIGERKKPEEERHIYLQSISDRKKTEEEHLTGRRFFMKEGVYDLIF